MKTAGAAALTIPLRPFWVPIRFTLSKKWKKRLRRIKGPAIKIGIAVAGAALSTVTLGASAIVAAGALAALAARDKAKAAKAAAEAKAKAQAGADANQALLQSVAQNQVDVAQTIRDILAGKAPGFSQEAGAQPIIAGQLGFSPMPGSGPSILETLGIAVTLGGIILLAGGPLILAGAAAAAGAVADRAGLVSNFFQKIRGQ